MDGLKVFSRSSHPALAQEICKCLAIPLATDFLLEHGARSVSAAVVHPVLSGRALERLAASRLERLLVTNTIPLAAASSKVEVLSVAPLLAEAITRIHDGRSVSALFSADPAARPRV